MANQYHKELEKTQLQLLVGVQSLNRFGEHYELQTEFVPEEKGYIRLTFYTNTNKYTIKAKPTYLGGGASCRKPRAGEDWTRGRDLADGDFTCETWREILADIVSYELVKICQQNKPDNVRDAAAGNVPGDRCK